MFYNLEPYWCPLLRYISSSLFVSWFLYTHILYIVRPWFILFQKKNEKREVETINRSQDINRLQGFYQRYREKNNVDTLKEEEKQLCESGAVTDEYVY